MTDSREATPPSPFIAHWAVRLASMFPGGRALDVAAGRGRHSLALASAGFRVTAVELQFDALAQARTSAHARGLTLAYVCADCTQFPLPRHTFHTVVVTRYLDRALFPALREALVPGGVLLYETFTEHQLQYDRGPRSRAHLLAPGELRLLLRGMDVLFDEEVMGRDAVARIAARRRPG